jgi:hypothetical protein
MDILPIAIGQAGNQINFELSKILVENNNSKNNKRYFYYIKHNIYN